MSGLSVIALVGALMLDGFFLFAAIFRLVMIADVRNDYVNPIEFAQRMNMLWPFELAAYTIVTLIMLFFGTWWVLFLHIPMIGYAVFLTVKRMHYVDPTKVLQGDTMNKQQSSAIIRLVFAIVWFFLYLYLVISEAISTLGTPKQFN